MGLGTEFSKLGTALKNAGSDILHSPVNMFKGGASTAAATTTTTVAGAGKTAGSAVAQVITAPFRFVGGLVGGGAEYTAKSGAKTAFRIVEMPFVWAVKGARHGVNFIGAAYRKAPVLMVPLTVIGGVAAVNSHMHRKAEKRTREAQQEQFAAIEAQVLGGGQQQFPQEPQAVATTYQVTPEEARMLQERMKGGQGPQTGHADGVLAAREAQPPQPTAQL